MRAVEKIENVKELIAGVSEDIAKLLSAAQVSIPIGEMVFKTTLAQIDSRIRQVKVLLGVEETHARND